MTYDTYRSLPIEGLYKLLEASVRDMLVALDSKSENIAAFNALKKQVELLLDIIEEKRLETVTKD